jgi:predicted ATPase
MHISRFKVYNYKSFRESQDLELRPGFNVIVGQNDAGKTALLQAISLRFVLDPHRSLRTMPTVAAKPEPYSRAEFTIHTTANELKEFARASQFLLIPLPELYSKFCMEILYEKDDPTSLERLALWLNKQQAFEFACKYEVQGGGGGAISLRSSPSFGNYEGRKSSSQLVQMILRQDGIFRAGGITQGGQEIGNQIVGKVYSGIYCFSAERLNVGKSNTGTDSALYPNASNLAQVLHVLQGNNPHRFQRLNSQVREIFPHVRDISTVLVTAGIVGIRIWNSDPDKERGDLAVPLSECGTGIGQVLAILYLVITSDAPRTILIDEPQSFLHPGAVRKLMEMLRRFRQHQFIIATHSPAVITATDPETITMVRLQDGETVLEQVDASDTKSLQPFLAEVGARLSDVFGADNVLWVEGETEEICFPKILQKLGDRSPMGTAIVGVVHTGDFEARDAETILKIYDRLTKGKSLLPPAIAFVFDRECRSEQEQHELSQRGKRLVHFLQRRMFENYLLNTSAIAAVVNSIDGFRPSSVEAHEIEKIIEEKRADLHYFCKDDFDPRDNCWVYKIDGAELLEVIFNELSETRVAFDKIRHSVALADWIIDNAPDDLAEIKELLLTILASKSR